MYTAQGKDYKDFLTLKNKFDNRQLGAEIMKVLIKNHIIKDLNSNSIYEEINLLLLRLQEVGEKFASNPYIFPTKEANIFISRYNSYVSSILHFENSNLYIDFIRNINSIRRSSLFLKNQNIVTYFADLLANTISTSYENNSIENQRQTVQPVIKSRTQNRYSKRRLEDVSTILEKKLLEIEIQLSKRLDAISTAWSKEQKSNKVKLDKEIETVISEVKNSFTSEFAQLKDLIDKTTLRFDNKVSELNYSLEEKKIKTLIIKIKDKKKWVLISMAILALCLFSIFFYSLYTADTIMMEAAKDKYIVSNLSYIYVLKHSFPIASSIVIISVFIFSLFRLLKSYLHLIETYEFKKDLIMNMRTMMEDPFFKEHERAQIVSKTIETLAHFNSSGLLDIKQEKNEEIMSTLINVLSKSKD